MAAKKKIIASVAAVATSAALLLGGTMAWQSANQVALNEASDVINPGGRLHDDFNGENKDVYVENFTDPEAGGENIFARVRLEEYFEIITNYTEDGAAPEKVHTIVGKQLSTSDFDSLDGENVRYAVNEDGTTGAPLYVRDYDIHVFTEEELNDAAVKTEDDGTPYAWWNWQLGGETIYMPTYNLNKDSLLADVNGVFDGAVGTITDKNPADPYAQYQDENFPYVEYTDNEEAYGYEVYDGDTNDADEIQDSIVLKGIIEDGEVAIPEGSEGAVALTDEEVPHYAKSTLKAELISMEDWLQMLEDNGGYDDSLGNYWVYDTDGWVYWSAPIEPGTATGLLLDGIELNQVMDDTWYYAINVVAQFITADDMGRENNTGFYDTTKGKEPTPAALDLLKAIGVEVPIGTAEELQAAFEQGGTITLPDTLPIVADESPATEVFPTIDSHLLMHNGGTLNGGTIQSTAWTDSTLFINNEIGWPETNDGAAEATVNDTAIEAVTSWAVRAQALDAPITLNDMTLTGQYGGLIAEYSQSSGAAGGSNTITLNDLSITANSQYPHAGYEWINSAVAAGYGADVVINGGSYTGDNAITILSSGGTVTVNGGTFTGALNNLAGANGSIIIKGGTFDHDPTAYVADGYEVVENGNGTWSVGKTEVVEQESAFGYVEVWKTSYNWDSEAGAWVYDYNADSKLADFTLTNDDSFITTDTAYHWIRVYDANGNIIPADKLTVTERTEENGDRVKTPDENFATPTYLVTMWGHYLGIDIEYNEITYTFGLDIGY